MNAQALWAKYKQCLCYCPTVDISLDYSRMNFGLSFFGDMKPAMDQAFAAMKALEAGEIANPDEDRMVGHYWLRDVSKAPNAEIKDDIKSSLKLMKKFTRDVHSGKLKPQRAKLFKKILVIGIGGSALGPQFVGKALSSSKDKMKPFFFDNTDPDGMDDVISKIEDSGRGLKETLCIVISKSGGTKETRNGMLEAKAVFERAGLKFERHAVAVTGAGSLLEDVAKSNGWLEIFAMWDWVGGRTSELAAVGLLPAVLQGLNIDGMLEGAREMDSVTRVTNVQKNPAALLALMWFHAGDGKGKKDMVLLPYKDRLELFSRYLQQLVMESLGKERDMSGKMVNQGIAVYGNKGSTDQHAYVQQLRDGVNNFFVTFIEVLKDRNTRSLKVEEGVTSGDFLSGFFQGTRQALYENNRESMTLTVEKVDAKTIGRLIALYERAVGFYGSLVNVNAYHQPGVEAGKKAATAVLDVQASVLGALRNAKGKSFTSEELARQLNNVALVETIHKVLHHLAANPDHRVKAQVGKTPFDTKFKI